MPEPADAEAAREAQFWAMLLRVLWTSLILLSVLGVLSVLTLLLGWTPYLLLCLIGLLAGIAIAVAVLGSARNRELTSLVLGTITLPLLAVYLGGLAVTNQAAFTSYSASFFPFLAHATGAVLAALWISRLWRSRPASPTPDQLEAGREPRPGAVQ